MKEYQVSDRIHASPEKIWAILTDIDKWPEWDPSCERIEGTLALGQKVKAFSKLSPGRGFAVKVSEFTPPLKMTWTGGIPLGLLRGERTFTLSELKSGVTEFSMREVFSGPMLALIGGSIPDMTEAFEGFVAGLKARAEA